MRSIIENNLNDIPVFLVAPSADTELFKQTLSAQIDIIPEEEFTESRCFTWLDGWRQQQVVKMSFYKLNIAEQYLAVDSDSYFIRPFRESDIFGSSNKTRLVATQNSPYFNPSKKRIQKLLGRRSNFIDMFRCFRNKNGVFELEFNTNDNDFHIPRHFISDSNYKNLPNEITESAIPYSFSRTDYIKTYFLPSPTIFSSLILKSFGEYISDKAEITFTDLIHLSSWEAAWYGHFAIKYFRNLVEFVEPLFFHFRSSEEVHCARKLGISSKSMKKSFLGITMASRHIPELQL
jgi:hypothetical protein